MILSTKGNIEGEVPDGVLLRKRVAAPAQEFFLSLLSDSKSESPGQRVVR